VLVGFWGSSAQAQHTILFTGDDDYFTIDLGNGLLEVGQVREHEVYSVTPAVGQLYSAKPFLSRTAQWVYTGDADNDGRYADDSTAAPMDSIDAILVRPSDSGPFRGRSIFISKETSADGLFPTMEDGDVFRFRGPGNTIETFVSEAQLLDAMGQAPTGDFDLNAIAQDLAGNLYFSFSDASETISAGAAVDGDLLYLDAANIVYDANGLITGVVPGTVLIAATEAEMIAMVTASGFKTSTGGDVSTSFDLSALEIDPNGGTFTPASSGLTLPNLLFCWQGFSNDGAIISTAAGGSIPSVNGVPMASTIATQGDQIGVQPDSTGIFGVEGLALIPQQADLLVVENWPVDLHTGTGTGDVSWHRVEWSGATPGGNVFWTLAVGPSTSGGFVASIPQPTGELFVGTLFAPLVALPSDGKGYGSIAFLFNDPALMGQNIVFQVVDLANFKISMPAAVQFI
jgi:hypothetical protein